MNRDLDTFETALLLELRETVAARSGTTPRGALRASRTSTPRKIALAAAAAAATVLVALIPGALSSPAYAVAEGASGEITVSIDRLEDAQQLQEELKDHGVTADVRYLGDNMQCQPSRFKPASSAPGSRTKFRVGTDGITVVLDRRDVDDGQTVVIAASRIRDGINGEVGIATGEVAPCQPVHLPNP